MISEHAAHDSERYQVSIACESLYEHHHAALIRQATICGCDEHDSKDAVQELFARLFRLKMIVLVSRLSFEAQRAWLFRTLKWIVLNMRRQRVSIRRGSGSPHDSVEALMEAGRDFSSAISNTPASEHDRRWAMMLLEDGLDLLRVTVSPAVWQCIEMSFFGPDAVEGQVRPPPALRVAAHRARLRLRAMVTAKAGPSAKAGLFQALCVHN
jgi:DNA-directed RNA polymerase specialized sigma24 family protein